MKKTYIYLGLAALGLYLWNKSRNAKITLTLAQIQSMSIADLNNLKSAISANSSNFVAPDVYLNWVSAEIKSRMSTGTPTSTATVPVVTTAPLKPVYANTGIFTPSI